MSEKYRFKLFISGMSVKSVKAIENFKKLSEAHFKENCEFEIIDISIDPDKALDYQIFAIPTLIKTEPEPVKTIIGDLSDTSKVLKFLNIK